MKHINTKISVWLVAVALMGLALSCDKQDIDRTFEGPYFVRFTDSSLTFRESYSPVIPIRVHNVGPVLKEPIRVTYTISGDARAGREYQIQGETGTVIIPANKSFGEIGVKLINNANNILESRTLTLTLTGVQPSYTPDWAGVRRVHSVSRCGWLSMTNVCLAAPIRGTTRFGQSVELAYLTSTSAVVTARPTPSTIGTSAC